MPKTANREWEVVEGLDWERFQDAVQLAPLVRRQDIIIPLKVRRKGSQEVFPVVVDIDDYWMGGTKESKRRPWLGLYGFSGTTYCTKFTHDLASQARVSVHHEVGQKIGRLVVNSIG